MTKTGSSSAPLPEATILLRGSIFVPSPKRAVGQEAKSERKLLLTARDLQDVDQG